METFHNLLWDLAIQFLHFLNFSSQLMNIASFLSNRKALLDWLSPHILYSFFKGPSQGSCLWPFLRLALLEVLLRAFLFKDCAIVAYSNDILAIIGTSTTAWADRKGNQILQFIQNWARENKIKISHEKSQVITFGNPTRLKRGPRFKLFGKNIKSKPTLTYLGITIDQLISFLTHLANKRQENSANSL